ncbi:hypothetical protein [Actinomadura rubrisoli]|uniref:hypothetical protein n=1 Tax=Actinomadura rubrisoli TaxID=2530368 RepID=UPI00140466C0|nr:hypothetical protein [Actinomadura rubrisoli]
MEDRDDRRDDEDRDAGDADIEEILDDLEDLHRRLRRRARRHERGGEPGRGRRTEDELHIVTDQLTRLEREVRELARRVRGESSDEDAR